MRGWRVRLQPMTATENICVAASSPHPSHSCFKGSPPVIAREKRLQLVPLMSSAKARKTPLDFCSRRAHSYPFFLLILVLAISLLRMTFGFVVLSRNFRTIRSIMKRKHDAILDKSCADQTDSRATHSSRLFGTETPADSDKTTQTTTEEQQGPVSLYRSQGIFAVEKPLNWTSNDVVSYIRGILEREARERGAKPVKVGSRRNKSRILKVGHGGTLDPLASGVLVIGVGKGTKELQSYLSGPKRYTAKGEFGFETTTLDMDEAGEVTKRAPFDHVTVDALRSVLPEFTGKIMQVPPIFSAIRKGGKKMYEQAREGKTAEELKLEPRQVEVYNLQLLDDDTELPSFALDIECGGGTYVRSLVRDIGYKLDTVATMTALKRTQQGQFTMEDVLEKKDWTADNIYDAIDKVNAEREANDL